MEKFEERLKAQDVAIMFNIKCLDNNLKCSEDEYKKIQKIKEKMEGKTSIRIYIKGNVFLFEDTNRTRWFTFVDVTFPLDKSGLEDAENTIANFYQHMGNVQDYSPLFYSEVEGEFINRKLIASATEYIELL